MKILFLGLSPSSALVEKLKENKFTFREGDAFLKDSFDVLFVGYDPKHFKKWLASFDSNKTYISVVTPSQELSSPTSMQFLIDWEKKHEVVALELFESMFWFSIQKALDFFSGKSSDKEVQSLKAQVDTITRELESNVAIAKAIQKSLLPKPPMLSIPDITVAFKFIPSTGKGGDYFDIFELGDRKRFGILLSESESHTITANLLSILLKVKLHEFKDRFTSPESFVDFLNQEFHGQIPKDTPLNFMFCIFERNTLQLKVVNGGEYQPVILRNSKVVTPIIPVQKKLGLHETPYTHYSVPLLPGDKIFFHSSGLLKFLTASELSSSLVAFRNLSPAETVSEINMQLKQKGVAKADRDISFVYFAVDEKAMYVA